MKVAEIVFVGLACCILVSCQPDSGFDGTGIVGTPTVEEEMEIDEQFNGEVDLEDLNNYANQNIPNYINDDNTRENEISDIGATLGRVLFYDTNLSSDNTISCASCHKQAEAFGDSDALSTGVNGMTGRHSMRLINPRFSDERRFFWDERARDLEEQTTMPIQDHAEMGFSGQNGDPDFDDLIDRLEDVPYYSGLFNAAFGSSTINEERIQNSLAQFIRSIQSFDSKYDAGRSMVNNPGQNFPNFTASENRGKDLFSRNIQFGQAAERTGGGLGCQRCHSAPEFDIAPNSRNNGVVSVANSSLNDFTVTRSPSLRDMFHSNGQLVGPLMHNGAFTDIDMVIDHYNDINSRGNPNLDNRLTRNGQGQNLNITNQERQDLIAFLRTLTGSDVYTNPKWSNPFVD